MSSGKRDVSTTPQHDSNVILNECEESVSALKFVVLLCFFQKCAMIFWEKHFGGDMKSLTFDKVLELKKTVQERFSVNVHFHDHCSSQSFSLDEPNQEIRAFIESYFSARNIQAVFNNEGTDFVLE